MYCGPWEKRFLGQMGFWKWPLENNHRIAVLPVWYALLIIHPWLKHWKTLTLLPAASGGTLTIDGGEHHPGVVVGDDVCVAVLWFIHFHVGVLPGELLARVDGLEQRRQDVGRGGERGGAEVGQR